MSDLSNTLRNMKFMQRTPDSRQKTQQKSSRTQPASAPLAKPIITIPDHPGCWRIINNSTIIPLDSTSLNSNHPSIIYRPSVFSIYERNYTRLSFQNFNKRLEPIMMKYGLKQELKHLEDGEIDPNDDIDNDVVRDDDDDDNDDDEKTSTREETDSIPVSTLVKTIGKKFAKKSFSRVQFDNKTRASKRRRRHPQRTRHGEDSMALD
jgi:hypothetical protein